MFWPKSIICIAKCMSAKGITIKGCISSTKEGNENGRLWLNSIVSYCNNLANWQDAIRTVLIRIFARSLLAKILFELICKSRRGMIIWEPMRTLSTNRWADYGSSASSQELVWYLMAIWDKKSMINSILFWGVPTTNIELIRLMWNKSVSWMIWSSLKMRKVQRKKD